MSIITGKTQLLGIIGYPVEHSLSSVMQKEEPKPQDKNTDRDYVINPVHDI
ncbi:MAG: hypothetical protein AB4060_11690 [Crocosphaera sp.]